MTEREETLREVVAWCQNEAAQWPKGSGERWAFRLTSAHFEGRVHAHAMEVSRRAADSGVGGA